MRCMTYHSEHCELYKAFFVHGKILMDASYLGKRWSKLANVALKCIWKSHSAAVSKADSAIWNKSRPRRDLAWISISSNASRTLSWSYIEKNFYMRFHWWQTVLLECDSNLANSYFSEKYFLHIFTFFQLLFCRWFRKQTILTQITTRPK